MPGSGNGTIIGRLDIIRAHGYGDPTPIALTGAYDNTLLHFRGRTPAHSTVPKGSNAVSDTSNTKADELLTCSR